MILNLTQHTATPEQQAAGVIDLSEPELSKLRRLLTFETLPTAEEIFRRAKAIARLAEYEAARRLGLTDVGGHPAADLTNHGVSAMIGGAPYLMATLERALRARGIKPLYAFSRRESVEQTMPDGSVRKMAVFRHLGFVSPSGS